MLGGNTHGETSPLPNLIGPVPITVMVSGSQTDGTTPVFTETNDAPAGVTVRRRLSRLHRGGAVHHHLPVPGCR